jgi:hypothetical protein
MAHDETREMWIDFLTGPQQAAIVRALRTWEFAVILDAVVDEHPMETLPGTDLHVCARCGTGLEPAREEYGRPLSLEQIDDEVKLEIAKHWAALLADKIEDEIPTPRYSAKPEQPS